MYLILKLSYRVDLTVLSFRFGLRFSNECYWLRAKVGAPVKARGAASAAAVNLVNRLAFWVLLKVIS